MSKISQRTVIFIFFMVFILIVGLLIKIPIDMIIHAQEPKVGGMEILFENGTTEAEVKTILENSNVTINYTLEYDSHYMLKRYYIIVDRDRGIAT
jgi:hypothetical protein